ncbi:protein eyes shut homolog [Ostrea edulis]|uniref:protein eyes shut homolog n=1 Tax=Ostrea edulis TaxID=37623 RepID=UPI0024AF3784|nr:protein eyes shut homolog [Ostrea edulis]
MGTLVRFLIYIVFFGFPIVQSNCTHDCMYDTWLSWDCACDKSLQKRIRNMCCPRGPKTREECANRCNLTLHWRGTSPCDKCHNGGVYDKHVKRCSCPPTYKGILCCDAVRCDENPCRHGKCNDTETPLFCTCDPGYTGTICDKEVQTLPPWLPYLEYAIITVTGMVILMTIGCACFKLVQVLGSRSKNEREEKKHRSFRQERKQSKRSQVLPKSMDF